MTLRYLGTNTLLLRKGDSCLLIDPHFTRPNLVRCLGLLVPDQEKIRSGLKMAGVEHLVGVVLTHTHYDHALDAAEVIRQSGGVLVGSESAAHLAEGEGLGKNQVITVDEGDDISLAGFRLKFFPARHLPFPPPVSWIFNGDAMDDDFSPPAGVLSYRSGNVFAVRVDRVLIFGSAGFIPGAYEDVGVDVVVLSVGGLELTSSTYLRHLFEEVAVKSGAQKLWLSHWDQFTRPLAASLRPIGLAPRTVEKIKQLGDASGLSVRVLPFNEPLPLPDSS